VYKAKLAEQAERYDGMLSVVLKSGTFFREALPAQDPRIVWPAVL